MPNAAHCISRCSTLRWPMQRTAADSRKQAQYELAGIVPPGGALGGKATFLKMLKKTDLLKHLEEQREPSKWGYLLIHELCITGYLQIM